MALNIYFDKILGTFREDDSIYTNTSPNIVTDATRGALSIKSHTNDASSNLIEYYDSDGNLIEKLDSDGFYAIRYRDEYVGDDWVNASGGAAPDIVNVTIGGVATQVMSFDGNSTEERKANSFEIAHDLPIALINNGTLKIEVHCHGSASDNKAGTVKMFFDWCYCPANAAPIAMTTVFMTKTIELNSIHHHKIFGVELPIPTGGYQIGDIIKFNIRRTPTDSGDTYGADFLLYKVALHVPTDGNGSRQRYIK